ncbi:MAG: alpha/beta hydrolase [Blastococcus sp.]
MQLPTEITQLSLISGWLHGLLLAGGLLALAGLLLLRRTRTWWTRRVPLAVLIAAGVLTAGWFAVDHYKSWPDGFPLSVLLWAGSGLLGLTLLALGWGRQRWWVRVLAVGAATLVVLGGADAIDAVYGAYPTVSTALQLPPYDAAVAGAAVLPSPATPTRPPTADPLWQGWHRPVGLPAHGAVFQVAIPPTRSGFAARAAWVYVPPAYLTTPRPALPLLLMIGGQPGGPRDWLDAGHIAERMDAWAATHAGLAPVVVMPDALGGETSNPLCMDSALGRADTYLAQDVTAWATRTLQVDPNHTHWAVGGFSYGGTCALQLAVAHPALFPTFFDASGQQSPTLGDRALTVGATFGGNTAAFDAVDPVHELHLHRYPGSAGWFVVGAQDRIYGPQQRVVVAAANAGGMTTVVHELPGGHSWSVWRPALVQVIPWLAARMGLSP